MKWTTMAVLAAAMAGCAGPEAAVDGAKTDFARGMDCVAAQRWGDAVAAFDDAVAANPKHADAYYQRGAAKLLRDDDGDSEAAVEDFSRALRLVPQFSDALFNRGLARARQGRSMEAVSDLREYLKLKPNDAAAHYVVAALCDDHFTNLQALALQHYKRHVELGGREADARHRVAALTLELAQPAPVPVPAPPGK